MSGWRFNFEPYAFKSRPWELNNLESIDVLDSMGSFIRIDYLNNKIQRILPIHNKHLNEDWISNKIRFVYDCQNNQRLLYPMVLKDNKYINLSWLDSFYIFFKKLKYYGLNSNILMFCDSLVDIDTVLSYRNFCLNIGTDLNFNYMNDIYINNDFLSSIFFNELDFNYESLSVIVLIGLNLRVELPILNSKFKKLLNDKIKFFSFGLLGSYISFYINNISNRLFDVVNIIKGKSIFNIIFFKGYSQIGFTKYFKFKPVLFLFGLSFFKTKNSFYLYNNFLFWNMRVKLNFYFFSLYNQIGYYSYLLQTKIFNQITVLKNNFIFLDNVDNFKYLNKFFNETNNFVVYKGFFFNNGAKKANLIFPSLTFFEEIANVVNYTHFYNSTKKITNLEPIVLNSKKFYFFLNFFFEYYFLNNFSYIDYFSKIIKYFDFLHLKIKLIKYKTINYNYSYITSINIENTIFSSTVINYYKTDIYSLNSKNLYLASLEYLKILVNFNK